MADVVQFRRASIPADSGAIQFARANLQAATGSLGSLLALLDQLSRKLVEMQDLRRSLPGDSLYALAEQDLRILDSLKVARVATQLLLESSKLDLEH